MNNKVSFKWMLTLANVPIPNVTTRAAPKLPPRARVQIAMVTARGIAARATRSP